MGDGCSCSSNKGGGGLLLAHALFLLRSSIKPGVDYVVMIMGECRGGDERGDLGVRLEKPSVGDGGSNVTAQGQGASEPGTASRIHCHRPSSPPRRAAVLTGYFVSCFSLLHINHLASSPCAL